MAYCMPAHRETCTEYRGAMWTNAGPDDAARERSLRDDLCHYGGMTSSTFGLGPCLAANAAVGACQAANGRVTYYLRASGEEQGRRDCAQTIGGGLWLPASLLRSLR